MLNFERILTAPDNNIRSALKQMDEVGEKILLVVGPESVLLGTVTDGDIRRWILKELSLDENIACVMNKKPIVLKNEIYSKDIAKKIMTDNLIEYLPVVDKDSHIVNVMRWTELFGNKLRRFEKINIPVVIMAGGKGTRLSPYTKILPKCLIPIGDKTILELIIDRFAEHGCNDFYLSLNYKATMIKSYFNDIEYSYNLSFLEEKDFLGTAGSLYMLKGLINGTFFLSNCDILVDADYAEVLDFHINQKNIITVIASVKHITIPYGICKIENGGRIEKIEEKPQYECLVNTGFYIIESDVINDFMDNSFLNMTEVIEKCISQQCRVGIYPISEKSWIDTGQMEGLHETFLSFGIK